ncbi:NB-ARC domains-containing protein [Tanacetum coccineum]
MLYHESLLTKLRVLNLKGNRYFHDISILGVMKELEILILSDTGIKEIPQEIGQLVNLWRLEVMDCQYLSRVAPGVISKLWRLEELRIGFKSLGGGIYDLIVEVMNLSKLTYLDLYVPRFDVIPEGFNIGKLKRFGIQIGLKVDRITDHLERCFVIKDVDVEIALLEWTKKLIKARPFAILHCTENIYNILPNLYHGGFNEFEHIVLEYCSNVSYLVDIADWKQLHVGEGKINEKFFGKLKHLQLQSLFRLKALWNCSDQYISLSNLITLDIYDCEKLITGLMYGFQDRYIHKIDKNMILVLTT